MGGRPSANNTGSGLQWHLGKLSALSYFGLRIYRLFGCYISPGLSAELVLG